MNEDNWDVKRSHELGIDEGYEKGVDDTLKALDSVLRFECHQTDKEIKPFIHLVNLKLDEDYTPQKGKS